MDAVEIGRQRAAELHSKTVAAGADPCEPYDFAIKVAQDLGLDVETANPESTQLDGGPVDLASPTARAGNYAVIRCGQFDILLAHFRKGSLCVATGYLVRSGYPIATLGSSGASDMPHLHIHAQRPGTAAKPFSGEPIPMRIGGRYLVRGDRP